MYQQTSQSRKEKGKAQDKYIYIIEEIFEFNIWRWNLYENVIMIDRNATNE